MEVFTILWREFIFFKRRLFNITTAAIITPLLYVIAFGWGLGSDVQIEGTTYMRFVIPGIIALSTMNTSFNAVSVRLNISRLYEKSFEYYLTSPVDMKLLALGHILSGAFRGMYAGILVLIISYIFKIYMPINFCFILVCFLNSFLFSAFGYGAALSINSHYDMSRFSTFIMTPMSFLCGTFFSLKKLPCWMKNLISILPLTQSTNVLRDIALGNNFSRNSIIILLIYSVVFYVYSVIISYREMN